ncbi:hypothetical protein AGMMS50262_16780 [Bacteroidia bacterium]|nr:hypothetical protein AGMMS50262_16780 [Bacteroidia bacterium]
MVKINEKRGITEISYDNNSKTQKITIAKNAITQVTTGEPLVFYREGVLHFGEEMNNASLSIYNLQGQLQQNQPVAGQSVSVDLHQGTYMVRIQNSEGVQTHKILIGK